MILRKKKRGGVQTGPVNPRGGKPPVMFFQTGGREKW